MAAFFLKVISTKYFHPFRYLPFNDKAYIRSIEYYCGRKRSYVLNYNPRGIISNEHEFHAVLSLLYDNLNRKLL